jgi:hypothetical protein
MAIHYFLVIWYIFPFWYIVRRKISGNTVTDPDDFPTIYAFQFIIETFLGKLNLTFPVTVCEKALTSFAEKKLKLEN